METLMHTCCAPCSVSCIHQLRGEGIEPVTAPVRGGTDGSQLTFRGLLCPNIGTGGYSCHGPYEHITAEHLETSANIVLNIIDENLK